MVKDYFTVQELAEAMDIYEVSAKELLEGTIKFTRNEIKELAEYKGVSVEMMME